MKNIRNYIHMKNIRILSAIACMALVSCGEDKAKTAFDEAAYKAKKDSINEVYEQKIVMLSSGDDTEAVRKLKEEKKEALKTLDAEFKPEKKEKKEKGEKKEEKSAEEKAEKKAMKLKEELNLNEKQYAQIKALLTEKEEKKQRLKENSADDKEAVKEKKKKLDEDYDLKIKALLTAEQAANFKGKKEKDKKN